MPAFNGFQCGEDDFDHHQAKRILCLAMDKLRKRADLRRKIGVDPQIQSKKVIRGNGGSVWDVLVFEAATESEEFTKNPHLTLGVGRESVSAMVTLPNEAPARKYRQVLIGLGKCGFRCMAGKVLESMRPVLSGCPGMQPRLRIWQRYGKPRNAPPRVDAVIDVDLRTIAGDQANGVKPQPEWVSAAFDVLKNKKSRTNIELQIGAKFPYRTCPVAAEPHVLNFVAKSWIACKPYIDVLFDSEHATEIPKERP